MRVKMKFLEKEIIPKKTLAKIKGGDVCDIYAEFEMARYEMENECLDAELYNIGYRFLYNDCHDNLLSPQ